MGSPPLYFWIVWGMIVLAMITAALVMWGGPRD
jgi:hypothetical protein